MCARRTPANGVRPEKALGPGGAIGEKEGIRRKYGLQEMLKLRLVL